MTRVWSFGWEGNGNPLQHSCLENSMERGAWWATVLGVAKSWTWLGDCLFILFFFHHTTETCNPMEYSQQGSSVHGNSLTRILEWVAIPFSRGSSQPRDGTQVSCIAGRFFTVWTIREAPIKHCKAVIVQKKYKCYIVCDLCNCQYYIVTDNISYC